MINRWGRDSVDLKVGSRHPLKLITRSDVDIMSANSDRRFVRKEGTSDD